MSFTDFVSLELKYDHAKERMNKPDFVSQFIIEEKWKRMRSMRNDAANLINTLHCPGFQSDRHCFTISKFKRFEVRNSISFCKHTSVSDQVMSSEKQKL